MKFDRRKKKSKLRGGLTDVHAQIRAMGRADGRDGSLICPFAPRSRAAKLWKQGREEIPSAQGSLFERI